MTFSFRFAVGLVCLLIVAVSGCVPIPIPRLEPTVVYGNAVAKETIRATVVPGQSREEVIERLGAPTYNFGSGRAYVYAWTEDTGSVLAVAPGGVLLGPAALAEARVFIVVFGEDGRSLKTGSAEVPLYRSVSGVVRGWMAAEGLDGYIRTPLEADPSVIILYRRSSAPCDPRRHAVEPYSPFAPAVTVDGQTIGDVLKGEFLRIVVASGTHSVAVEAVPGFRRFDYEGILTRFSRDIPASLTVEVMPRQMVHAETWLCTEADADTGIARYRMHLELREAEQARADLTSLKAAWP
jgi:hypothetical protein